MTGGRLFAGVICTDGFPGPLSKLGHVLPFRAKPVEQSVKTLQRKVRADRTAKPVLPRLRRCPPPGLYACEQAFRWPRLPAEHPG